MSITIGWLYPDLMSTYGDRGNIITLQKRCAWRGISTNIKEITVDDNADSMKNCDLFFMGGGEDRKQEIASSDLIKTGKAEILREMLENNIPGLFICGAYQFLGQYYQPAVGERIPGLGILDLYTINPGPEKLRCIGNIITTTIQLRRSKLRNYTKMVGFENHGGRTYLGKNVQPLGTIIKGFGNNGEDKTEGAIYKNTFGTYLHGPLLPKNPGFADHFLKLALQKKYQNEVKLEELDDTLEITAHDTVIKKYGH